MTYDFVDGVLYANITCTNGVSQTVHCVDSTWSDVVECTQQTAAEGVGKSILCQHLYTHVPAELLAYNCHILWSCHCRLYNIAAPSSNGNPFLKDNRSACINILCGMGSKCVVRLLALARRHNKHQTTCAFNRCFVMDGGQRGSFITSPFQTGLLQRTTSISTAACNVSEVSKSIHSYRMEEVLPIMWEYFCSMSEIQKLEVHI